MYTVSPLLLEPYYELGMMRSCQDTFISFRMMWSRIQQKTSIGRYEDVEVCPTWVSFRKFYADMGPKPNKVYTLDRIDHTKGYHKDNCRWADKYTQSRNRKSCIIISDSEDRLTLKEMCAKHKLNYKVIYYRIRHNWTIGEAFGTPIGAVGTNNSTQQRVELRNFILIE